MSNQSPQSQTVGGKLRSFNEEAFHDSGNELFVQQNEKIQMEAFYTLVSENWWEHTADLFFLIDIFLSSESGSEPVGNAP